MEQLKEIFELKDIVWFCLGIAVPAIYNRIKELISTWRTRRKIKKEAMHFRDKEIVSLAHGNPYFLEEKKLVDLELKIPNDEFYISMPADIKGEIEGINPEFDNTQWDEEVPKKFFDGQSEDEMLSEVAKALGLGVPETKALYEEEKRNVAQLFLTRANAGEPYFNGEMYGVKKIQEKRIGKEEHPAICIHSYKTDYYTHRVMAALYRRVYDTNPSIMPGTDITRYNAMRYFLTSIGMNVLVYLEEENKVILVKRSGKLFNMTKSKWHVSMNEAISITDIDPDNKAISLKQCVYRGLSEELGLAERTHLDGARIHYSDLFFIKNPFETGITAYVSVPGLTVEDLSMAYETAKDKELESDGFKAVSFTKYDLQKFMKDEDLTDVAHYSIKMLLARYNKGATL